MIAGARRWLIDEWRWPGAALFAAALLLPLLPVLAATAGVATTLVVLQLPVYLVHQFEEHRDDRFRRYLHERVLGVPDAMTAEAASRITCVER